MFKKIDLKPFQALRAIIFKKKISNCGGRGSAKSPKVSSMILMALLESETATSGANLINLLGAYLGA
jgi:hypothetical protein